MKPITSIASKAGQLEACALDDELFDVLKDQLNRVLAFFRPSLINKLQPELEAFFKSLVFYFSVWTNNPTPGSMFQNLRYVDDRPTRSNPYDLRGSSPSAGQRILHALLNVFLPWIWSRFGRYISEQEWGALPADDWRRKFWLCWNRLESTHKCASLLHFLAFLVDGRFRSLGDRLVGIRLLHMDPMRTRSLNFEFMSQLLVWQSFLHFLGFLRPLMSSAAFRAALAAAWARVAPRRTPPPSPPAALADAAACGLCMARAAETPHANACGHTFCYYCLRSALLLPAHSRPACLRCAAPLSSCARAPPPPPPPPPAA